jgi:RNA polymerase sigma factor (TIGR02999 family)
MSDVTEILRQIETGNLAATEQLLPLVYDELRHLAARQLSRQSPGQTLQPTALVHEAYLRLVGSDPGQEWNSRGHFFTAAAEAMRRILVERARQKRSLKRGGQFNRVDVDVDDFAIDVSDDLLTMDEALKALSEVDPTAARLVELRYFSGLTSREEEGSSGVADIAYLHRA